MTLDDAWMAGAACRGSDVDFHPEGGGPGAAKKAREVCLTCPVIEECLDYALVHNEQLGVWGGMTLYERRSIPKHIRRSRENEWLRLHPQQRRRAR